MKTINTLFMLLSIGTISFSQSTCSSPNVIIAGQHTVDTIMGIDVPDPICAENGEGATSSEWFEYTPSDDYTVTLTTDLGINTGLDTRFHVYTGTCGALVCHAGDDDSGSGYLSEDIFHVYQGTTYLIAFDDRWSSEGFDFLLEENPFDPTLVPPVTFTLEALPNSSSEYRRATTDMNGDYLDDVVSVGQDIIQIHYQNAGGGFTYTEIMHAPIDFLPSWSLAIGDFDKNGFNDMVYGGGSGVTFMKANADGTQYEEISGTEYVFSQRSNFVDINNDGHLDAFVCHDVDPNVYYMNDGNGNLEFNQGGIGDHPEGGHYGSIWTDYDNDGDMDLFIAKCRGGTSTARINQLFQNDGEGNFTDVSVAANMYDPVQTWSSAWNDFDNDGYMDAVVGASSDTDGTHKFMYNNGDGTFSDITAGSGWDTHAELNIEHASYDFDNDGFTDVLGGGGEIMFNDGDLTFTAHALGVSNGSIGDLNNDGFLDIRVGNSVYYNDGNNNNWITVNLQGIESNSNGIGARIEIYGDWGKQIREIRSGVGFRYMNTLNAHFGIGESEEIDSLIVKWPSGIIDIIRTPIINESILVIEGAEHIGLIEEDGKQIRLYPNPVSNELTIENSDLVSVEKVYIISHLGEIVQKLDTQQHVFDVSQLTPGMYVFIMEDQSGKKYAEQFVKR